MIIINSDEDLRNFSNSVLLTLGSDSLFKLDKLCELPAYRCLILLGTNDDGMFVEFYGFMSFRKIDPFLIRWSSTMEVFTNIVESFGFYNPYKCDQCLCFCRSPNFNIEDENRLITKLLNTKGNYMQYKYGLK